MPVTAIHPGEHLGEELSALEMSAAELARQLQVPTNRITELLNGRRAITCDTALRLAHFFGTSAEFWLRTGSRIGAWIPTAQSSDSTTQYTPVGYVSVRA